MPGQRLRGESVKTLRLLRGWSQPELGRRAGLDVWRIWAIESDVYPPIPSELAQLLRAFTAENLRTRRSP
jgi:transcriptional regulator with XRE-family HTH domain